jgi:hypothetical protein
MQNDEFFDFFKSIEVKNTESIENMSNKISKRKVTKRKNIYIAVVIVLLIPLFTFTIASVIL